MFSSPHLQSAEATDALLRAVDAARHVGNAHQYYGWQRLHLHRFIPHDIALCRIEAADGAASARLLHSVPLPAELAHGLKQADGPLWRDLRTAWRRANRAASLWRLDDALLSSSTEAAALLRSGWGSVLVHGVDEGQGACPPMLHAFIGGPAETPHDARLRCEALALCLPSLHFAAFRAFARTDEGARAAVGPTMPAAGRALLSPREIEVLRALRGARNNAQIGEQLDISALTVKNHLRNIMRKLGVCNRAQALGEAMSRGLFP